MTPTGFRAQQAIADLRRVAHDVVSLCDSVIYSQEGEASRAMRALPARIQVKPRHNIVYFCAE
jgi:hypothetical protein